MVGPRQKAGPPGGGGKHAGRGPGGAKDGKAKDADTKKAQLLQELTSQVDAATRVLERERAALLVAHLLDKPAPPQMHAPPPPQHHQPLRHPSGPPHALDGEPPRRAPPVRRPPPPGVVPLGGPMGAPHGTPPQQPVRRPAPIRPPPFGAPQGLAPLVLPMDAAGTANLVYPYPADDGGSPVARVVPARGGGGGGAAHPSGEQHYYAPPPAASRAPDAYGVPGGNGYPPPGVLAVGAFGAPSPAKQFMSALSHLHGGPSDDEVRRRDAQRAEYVADLDRQVKLKKDQELRRKETEREADRRMFPHAAPSPGPPQGRGRVAPPGQWAGRGPSGRDSQMELQTPVYAQPSGGGFQPPPQQQQQQHQQQQQQQQYQQQHAVAASPQPREQMQPVGAGGYGPGVGAYPGALLGPPAHQQSGALPSPGGPGAALSSPNPARKGGFLAAASRDLMPGPTEVQLAAAESKRQQLLRDLDEQVRAKQQAEQDRKRAERRTEDLLEAKFAVEASRKAALEMGRYQPPPERLPFPQEPLSPPQREANGFVPSVLPSPAAQHAHAHISAAQPFAAYQQSPAAFPGAAAAAAAGGGGMRPGSARNAAELAAQLKEVKMEQSRLKSAFAEQAEVLSRVEAGARAAAAESDRLAQELAKLQGSPMPRHGGHGHARRHAGGVGASDSSFTSDVELDREAGGPVRAPFPHKFRVDSRMIPLGVARIPLDTADLESLLHGHGGHGGLYPLGTGDHTRRKWKDNPPLRELEGRDGSDGGFSDTPGGGGAAGVYRRAKALDLEDAALEDFIERKAKELAANRVAQQAQNVGGRGGGGDKRGGASAPRERPGQANGRAGHRAAAAPSAPPGPGGRSHLGAEARRVAAGNPKRGFRM